MKRSFKNFTPEGWKNQLLSRDWSTDEASKNLDEMTETFNSLITKALDEIAPIKSFTVKSHYNLYSILNHYKSYFT